MFRTLPHSIIVFRDAACFAGIRLASGIPGVPGFKTNGFNRASHPPDLGLYLFQALLQFNAARPMLG